MADSDAEGSGQASFSNTHMARLASQALPQGASLSPAAVTLLGSCCREFVKAMADRLAGERAGGKLLTPEQVDDVLLSMGLKDIVAQAQAQQAADGGEGQQKPPRKKAKKAKYTSEEMEARKAAQEALCGQAWKDLYG